MKTGELGARPKVNKRYVVVAVVLALTILGAAQGNSLEVGAQQMNRVGLVVDFGDRHITRCIEFGESEITGYDVLRRAGLSVVVDASNPMGVIICDIDNTSGCPGSNCFCQCQGSPCVYWAYHYLQGGSWQYSLQGASSRKVHHGDVEGWGWGEGALNNSGAQPPAIPFDQICTQPATDTPIPPTDTPVPTNTAIPPTDTPAASDTPEPTSAPAPEAWFRLDKNPTTAGSCTLLRWDSSHAVEVYLDGAEVSLTGSREVCPAGSTDYELRVVGLEEEETYLLTLGVTGVVAATATPQPTVAPGSPSPTTGRGEATLPSPAPTTQAAAPTPAAPTSGSESGDSADSSPTETQLARSTPTPGLSPEPTQIAQIRPTATAGQVAQAEAEQQEPPLLAGKEASSPFLPIGYAGFSLIVGGLLGWLVYVLRFRGRRA